LNQSKNTSDIIRSKEFSVESFAGGLKSRLCIKIGSLTCPSCPDQKEVSPISHVFWSVEPVSKFMSKTCPLCQPLVINDSKSGSSSGISPVNESDDPKSSCTNQSSTSKLSPKLSSWIMMGGEISGFCVEPDHTSSAKTENGK